MEQPILPKEWFNKRVRVIYRESDEIYRGWLRESNAIGLLLEWDKISSFVPWSAVYRVFVDE